MSAAGADFRQANGPLEAARTRASVRRAPEGRGLLVLSVPGLRCGGCVAAVERALNDRDDVVSARANLTLLRVSVTLRDADGDPAPVMDALAALGHAATPAGEVGEDPPGEGKGEGDAEGRALLHALAVAGFGTANVMLLSVGVWAGAEGSVREALHLVSALVALPVVAWAGRPFFASALGALRARRTNMDVPISLGVLLALALSLFETVRGGEHVFFDAAVTLLFFLLAGRYLDHLMRARARSAVDGLVRLSPGGAMVRGTDGALAYTALKAVLPGDVLSIAPGECVPVDVRVLAGDTDLDRSLVTGEAMPVAVGPGDTLEAGTLNLTGTIEAEALRSSDRSFLSRMIRMQSAAEGARGPYVRVADRAARLYAPVVHLLALATFAGWMLTTGGDWRASAFVAISVLIVTCPCALGLAVPVAHVVAAGRLMRAGILMKDGAGLERLAEIDRAVFDKTGTLTTGTPTVTVAAGRADERAGALAARSVHPVARAIAAHLPGSAEVHGVAETPGFGIEGEIGGVSARLGRAEWVAEIAPGAAGAASPVFAVAGGSPLSFALSETLRPGAADAVDALRDAGIPVAILSGDGAGRVARVAARLGVGDARHGATPADKIMGLEALRRSGHRALMVGDGLNDAAALAAAHVSMAPASASDVGRTIADFVFLRDGLDAVPAAHRTARDTARIVRQNFALAVAYNCIAVPLAMAGMVTPLIAALAMSGSSILVIANALRLDRTGAPRPGPAPAMRGAQVPA